MSIKIRMAAAAISLLAGHADDGTLYPLIELPE